MQCKKMTCGERKKFCRECEYHQPTWKYRFCNFTTCPYRIRDSTFRKKPLKRDFFHRKEVVGMNGLSLLIRPATLSLSGQRMQMLWMPFAKNIRQWQ